MKKLINKYYIIDIMLYSSYYLCKNSKPNLKFVVWINNVEKNIFELFGVHLLDIPDEDYMRYFESDYETNQMVQIIQESNGFVNIKHKIKNN
jgi:hypothetical protein